ncbi:putative metallophosphoesterase [Namao virus]|nr:putative metallophosphoesterase [Namao virus]
MASESQSRFEFKQDCTKYNYLASSYKGVKRILAIGDIHGDLALTVKSLLMARVIAKVDAADVKKFNTVSLNHQLYFKWIGEDSYVVQVGDQIDRCRPLQFVCPDQNSCHYVPQKKCNHNTLVYHDENSDFVVMEFLDAIDKIAQKNNPPGRLISLLGNHELMNLRGNFDYVTPKGMIDRRAEIEKRRKYFACHRLGAVILNDFLFVHGGIIREIAEKYDVYNINKILRKYILNPSANHEHRIIWEGDSSPLWNRDFGIKDPDCNHLKDVLQIYKLNGMVVGHTPQFIVNKKKINGACSNKVFRIDSGSSLAFKPYSHFKSIRDKYDYDHLRSIQILEINTNLDTQQYQISIIDEQAELETALKEKIELEAASAIHHIKNGHQDNAMRV